MLDKEIKEKIKEYYERAEYGYKHSEKGSPKHAIMYGEMAAVGAMLSILGETEFLEELGKNLELK